MLQAEDFQLPDTSESYRDLSAWRVSIPRVDTRQDANNKPFPVFSISVQRIDVKSEGIWNFNVDLCVCVCVCVYARQGPWEYTCVTEQTVRKRIKLAIDYWISESRLLVKLIVTWLPKKILIICGNRDYHWIVFCAGWIQSTPPHPIPVEPTSLSLRRNVGIWYRLPACVCLYSTFELLLKQ